ncbi:GPI inositol-deacylase-like [Saccostrea echinata]|uniref:GPI inositol-deacylase-like n=1 Tax=Saccostrea echinata TaxID=191078 RepID=UPI002A834253|nr:GPI inositol-deacylase-like [Saccostrea echinata]
MATLTKLLYSAVCIAVILYGIIDVLTNYEQNKCHMTYMFEQPEYLEIPLSKAIKDKFPRYSLYVYGEGVYARNLEKMNFQGIPVLFIPGNSGSHKQARSLASVSLRRAMDKRTYFFFNYFTVDFNEDLTALFGGVLQDQTEFVHTCIKKILRLYKNAENKPSTVLLVGHSMGGMIARALFTLPDFDHKLVNTIITQSTPHQIPVLSVDSYIASFYRKVNSYWKEYGATNLSHVTVVSTGGGHRDYQVRNGLSSLQGIIDPSRGISSSTISMPKAWVSTDHLCAVWCKEVVMATVRAIFDIVDTSTNQISTDADRRMDVFRHYFLSHSGAKKYIRTWAKEITLDPAATWMMENGLTWEFARDKVKEPTYISVPIVRKREDTFVAVSDIEANDWICVCKSETGDGRCKKCKNLSKNGEAIPPSDSGRKVIHINLKKYKSMTHLVIIVPRTYEKVEVMGDIYRKDDRHLSYRMPGFMDMLMTYPESVTQGTGILTLFNDTLFYDLHLLNMDLILKAFTVKLEPKRCSAAKPDLHDGYMMKLHVPGSNEDTISFNKLSETGYLPLKLQSGNIDNTKDVELKVYTDPTCTYQLMILVSPVQMLGQFVRFYGTLLPAFMVAVLLMGVVHQLRCMAKDGICPALLDAISDNGKPYFIIPVVMFLNFICHLSVIQQILGENSSLLPDTKELTNQGLMLRSLPLLLYLIALGLVNFQCLVIDLGMKFLSRVAGLLFSCCPVPASSDRLVQVSLVLALVLSGGLCGTLGLIICYFICIVKVLRTYHILRQNILESRTQSRYNLYLTVLLLLMWVTALNLPPLIVWLRNIQYFITLHNDPSCLTAIICILFVGALFICDDPLSGRDHYFPSCIAVYILTVLLVLYGTLSTYRISYFITCALIMTAVPQVVNKVMSAQQKKGSDM